MLQIKIPILLIRLRVQVETNPIGLKEHVRYIILKDWSLSSQQVMVLIIFHVREQIMFGLVVHLILFS